MLTIQQRTIGDYISGQDGSTGANSVLVEGNEAPNHQYQTQTGGASSEQEVICQAQSIIPSTIEAKSRGQKPWLEKDSAGSEFQAVSLRTLALAFAFMGTYYTF